MEFSVNNIEQIPDYVLASNSFKLLINLPMLKAKPA